MAEASTVVTSVPDGPPNEPPEPPVDAALPPDDSGEEAAIEARAREMGWKPLAEYRGPPGRWQPAKDFIDRGENILPIVRQQNRALTERVGKLEGEISGLRSTAAEQLQIIKDLRDMGQKADQRGYDRAMAEIKARQRAAVEAGDTKAYDQLVEQAEALADSRQASRTTTEPPPKPAEPPPRPAVSAAVQAFVSENTWFNTNPFLTRKMIDRHVDVIQEGEVADEAAQLTEARRRLMEDYPDRFDTPPPREPAPRRRPASVARPTPEPPPPPSNTATINSIADPAERSAARDAFNRMKRQMPDYTEAEYMALYADPHGDILSMQQKPRSTANGR